MFRSTEHYSDEPRDNAPEPLHKCTLSDVARELGVSAEMARQIELTAMRKFRLALRLLELAPPAEAWAIVDSLRAAPIEQFREAVRQLKREQSV